MELGDAHETMSVLLQEHAKLQQTCERLEAEAAASQKLTRVRICESICVLVRGSNSHFRLAG